MLTDIRSTETHATTTLHSPAATEGQRNRLLRALPASERAALARHFEAVTLRAGEVLQRPGGPIGHVYFPEGAVIALALEGRHEVDTIGADGMLGIEVALGVEAAEGWATVRVAGRALRAPAAAFRQALGELPSLRPLLDRHLHACMLQMSRAVACSREHLTVPRLASLLLRLRDQAGSDRLALTQEQVARLVGVSRRASVTEALRVLRSQELLDSRRGGLIVGDADRLMAVACPCYQASRGQMDRVLGAA